MKKIKLTQGKFTLVDDEDFEELNKWNWSVNRIGKSWYAVGSVWNGTKKLPTLMHRFILQAPKNFLVDHIDGNGLNNQKSNLRLCTHSNNMQNSKKPENNTSGYKGVTWHKGRKLWQAQIMVNGKSIYLGRFVNKEDAAHAYDTAAVKYHGEFAKTNK